MAPRRVSYWAIAAGCVLIIVLAVVYSGTSPTSSSANTKSTPKVTEREPEGSRPLSQWCTITGFKPDIKCGDNDGMRIGSGLRYQKTDGGIGGSIVCPAVKNESKCEETIKNGKLKELPGDPRCWLPPASKQALTLAPMFMIPGTAKAGTSSFFDTLMTHPMLKSKHKELNFYNKAYPKGLAHYATEFPAKSACETAFSLDGSVNYMFSRAEVLERIAHDFPCMKFIVLLRDPVSRAYSEYQMDYRRELEYDKFEDVIEQRIETFNEAFSKYECHEDESKSSLFDNCPWYECFRDIPHKGYIGRSLYNEVLKLWFQYFPRSSFLFIKSEDFFDEEKVEGVMNETWKFLKLPYIPYKPLDPVLPFKNKNNYTEPGEYDPIKAGIAKKLQKFFKPHNKRLYNLLNRDFGWDKVKYD